MVSYGSQYRWLVEKFQVQLANTLAVSTNEILL